MKKTLIVNAGLPRAGTTLLQNILGQNPSIFPENNSGLRAIIHGGWMEYINYPPVARSYNKDNLDKCLIKYHQEGIQGYLNELTEKPIIIDKDRDWVGQYRIFKKLIPNFKVIYLVRDLRSIYSSFEKQYQKELFKNYNWPFTEGRGHTLKLRYENYTQLDLISYPLEILEDIFNGKYEKNICFIRYEDLCTFPKKTMENIYNYLNIDYFDHDFNNIKQITKEFDNNHVFGDHNISNTLYPPIQNWEKFFDKDMLEDMYSKNSWFFNKFNYQK